MGIPTTMRAGRLVEHGTMVCEEAEVRLPGDGGLLVKSGFASICGSDLHTVFPLDRAVRPGPPGFPGHEGLGEIVVSNHPDFGVGDRVLTVPNFVAGMCFAEYQAIGGAFCVPLPDCDVPDEKLLMAQQLGTVVFALKRRLVDVSGKNVAVIGQGSAGAFFSFLLRRAGAAKVLVSDLSDARLAYGRALGADVAVNASTDDFAAAVREATGGRGADMVVDAVGADVTLAQTVEVAAPGGEILWFGLPWSGERMPFSFQQFFSKRLCAATTFGAQEEPGHASFREALSLIEKGEIDLTPMCSHVLPVEEIGRAFELAHSREEDALKVSVSF